MEDNRILKVARSTDKYRLCNVCGNSINDHECNQQLVGDNIMHELSFGKNNNSTTICLCNRCLNDFAEKLWEYI